MLVGGAMMGRLASGPDEPVTKTTGGVLVLGEDHALVARYRAPWRAIEGDRTVGLRPMQLLHGALPLGSCSATRSSRIGPCGPSASAWTRNRTSWERSTAASATSAALFSCPEALDPKNVCVHDKPAVRARGLKWTGDPASVRPHPLFEERRIPMRRLVLRLGLKGFRNEGAARGRAAAPEPGRPPAQAARGRASLAGRPARRECRRGTLVAKRPEGSLGADIHASIAGRVASTEVTAWSSRH